VIANNKNINTRQPGQVPRLTNLGFKKIKMPKGLFKKCKRFLKQNRANEQQESNIMGYINNERLPTTMIYVSEELRQAVFKKSAKILSNWIDKRIYTGPTKLEPQSCYGIRRYVNGSVLQSHVDRGDTHAVSAILHVGSEEMEEVSVACDV
jgi:hypothetical protein